MAVLQMQRFSICALKENRKAILEELQALGITQIDNSRLPKRKFLKKQDTQDARQLFDKRILQAEHALEVLDEYCPVKSSMLAMFEGKEWLEKEQFDKTVERAPEILKKAAELVALNKEISDKTASIQKMENRIEALAPWMEYDLPINFTGTKLTEVMIGTLPTQMTLDEIKKAIADKESKLDAYEIYIISTETNTVYLAGICLKEEALAFEDALRSIGFARPAQASNETPADLKESLLKQIEQLNTEIEEIKVKIGDYADCRHDFMVVSDYYRTRSDKYQVLGDLPQSKSTFFISGYVPEEAIPLMKERVIEPYEAVLDFQKIKKKEQPPVLLSNNGFSDCVEGVVASFGLPLKGELDPTVITSFFYIVFFGMMLSDAGYGLLLALGCAFLLLKFKHMPSGLKKSIKMFFWGGVSTIVWGILFGGFFGNLLDIVPRIFGNGDWEAYEGAWALWFVPLENPMKLLIWCIIFGLIHLFMGMAIHAWDLCRKKKVWDAIREVGFWMAFLVGLILLLLPTSIMASILGTQIDLPNAVDKLALVLTIVGAIGLLLFTGKKRKPGMRIALGVYEIYGITSWLSDILSYSRLLALGMATGVIASVINQIGTMPGKSVFGFIFFIVVLIIGTLLSLFINTLSAYVHTNRLQYVEFYGKFYEGGSDPFVPFTKETKYIDIKEEKNKWNI